MSLWQVIRMFKIPSDDLLERIYEGDTVWLAPNNHAASCTPVSSLGPLHCEIILGVSTFEKNQKIKKKWGLKNKKCENEERDADY